MGGKYVDAEKYTQALTAGLDTFEKALTHRWRAEAAEAIRNATDIPQPGIMHCEQVPDAVRWDYRAPEARGHINDGHCTFLAWVEGGQQGELSAVTCTGHRGPISSDIGCGVGDILSQVHEWAWGEREKISEAIPRLEGHKIATLEQAYNTFIRVGGRLGLAQEPGGGGVLPGPDQAMLPPFESRKLAEDVEWLSNNDSDKGWYKAWTGLAADTVKDGFIASTAPTMRHQSALLGWLANLYSERASMIAVGRNNVLHWLKWASKALSEKHQVTVDYTSQWQAMSTVGTLVGATTIIPVATAAAVAGPFAAVVGLVAFVGQAISDPAVRTEDTHTMQNVVITLGSEMRKTGEKLDAEEQDYDQLVDRLTRELAGLHSYDLELYDLTGTKPAGGKSSGYTADVDTILDVGQRCYEASEAYAAALSTLAPTASADSHLAGRDMQPTRGDTQLAEIRDAVESFLKTTAARYLLACDRIEAAAREYAKRDADQQAVFTDKMKDWDKHGIGDHDVDLDPTKPGVQSEPGGQAGSTDRSEIEPGSPDPAGRSEHEEKRRKAGEEYGVADALAPR